MPKQTDPDQTLQNVESDQGLHRYHSSSSLPVSILLKSISDRYRPDRNAEMLVEC